MQCFFKPFSRCFFLNKRYFNWYLQSYTNPFVYSCSCDSDDSDLEDSDHIDAIEEENPQISFAGALQMLDQLQNLADTEMGASWPPLLKSYKTWGYNARNKLRLKTFSLQNSQCSWYIRFVYLYPKNCFFFSLHPFYLYFWWIIVRSPINQKIMPGGLRTVQLAWEHTKIGKPTPDGHLYKTKRRTVFFAPKMSVL